MKRFLMLVGVAVVAAAMYVAASPASHQSKFASEKQLVALEKKVAAQGKTLKLLKQFAGIEATLLADCVQVAVPIDQFGNPDGTPTQEGYVYQQPFGGTAFPTTALDVTDPTTDTGALFITGGDSSCGSFVNGTFRHRAAKAGIALPHASHHWSFSAHH